ncbi:MAG: hypothetical protein NZR01_12675 [Bryobacteraceae bacterium]|nr:hypothetical protein [Bryobacteraceae bacterium]
MRRWISVSATLLATAVLLLAVSVNGDLNVLGKLTAGVVDFSDAASTAPMKAGTVLPSACGVGQTFFKTDAAAGQNIFLCTAANTWTQAAGAAAPVAFDWKPGSRYVVFRSEMAAFYNQGSPAYLGDIILSRVAGSANLNNPSPVIGSLYPGLASITTTSTAGNRSAWAASLGGPHSAEADSLLARSNLPWEMDVVFRYPAAADFANSSLYLGMMASTSEAPPRGIAVRYLAGTDTNFVFAYGSQNTWGSTLNTGVAPDTNWHRLRIRSDGSAQNRIWLRLDNGTEYSACPSGCDLGVSTYLSHSWSGVFFVSIATNEAAVKTVQLDYLHFWLDRGSER